MTETITVSGYDPFDFQEEVDVTLHITGRPPQHQDLADAKFWAEVEALHVAMILRWLPQSVRQHLLVRLLQEHVNLYGGKDPAAIESQG